ncbi:pleckstrin homology domain-containing family S member 1, partial [Engraulis encrasicolus]|uniref:pleckstrin homology domain-containing family S member 1 n=1 Tax=Engraulis encrasicolus TaxID=184585 RepID=UPI002FD5B282
PQRSWTRRYFVLSKTSEETWTLKYFKNEKKERALGKILVSDISMLMFCPESHSTFGLIHEHFRCPSACVLLLRAKGRDYFLVGENSWETDGWFNALYSVLRSHEVI